MSLAPKPAERFRSKKSAVLKEAHRSPASAKAVKNIGMGSCESEYLSSTPYFIKNLPPIGLWNWFTGPIDLSSYPLKATVLYDNPPPPIKKSSLGGTYLSFAKLETLSISNIEAITNLLEL